MCVYHCSMSKIYSNYEQPIEEMKQRTARLIPFKFSFMRKDGTVCVVRKAALRRGSVKDKNAKYKLQYADQDTGDLKSCFIPSLLSFNNVKIDVSKWM